MSSLYELNLTFECVMVASHKNKKVEHFNRKHTKEYCTTYWFSEVGILWFINVCASENICPPPFWRHRLNTSHLLYIFR